MDNYVATSMQLIQEHYGTRCAERSQVPLMNHITQGCAILASLDASQPTYAAWCLHPLLQDNKADTYESFRLKVSSLVPLRVLLLTLQYSHYANSFLSEKVYKNAEGQICVKHLPPTKMPVEVRHMLIADKVQNYKDFCIHHLGTHPRTDELEHYFKLWFEALALKGKTVVALTNVAKHQEAVCQ